MLTSLGLVLIGLVALVVGGELLVRGASRLAALARISPLVIGLTVVAFGTSAPELAVSLRAGFAGQTDIAVGNVIGSNIFNVLFILGISAVVCPLIVSSQLIRLDVPLMIVVSFLTLLFGLDGRIGRGEGILLFGVLIAYTGWLIVQSRKEIALVQEEFEHEFALHNGSSKAAALLQIVLIAAGLVLLGIGSQWLVQGAVTIARLWGMSELLIGLTIVAAGTSLPEVAASVMASIKRERDIAVGNVVGSNIFNLLSVLGLTAAIVPGGVKVARDALVFDFPVMIAVAVACLPIFITGHRIDRWEGGLFFAYYIAYTTYLVLAAISASIAPTFGAVMLGFVVPLTVLTLLISLWRHRKIAA